MGQLSIWVESSDHICGVYECALDDSIYGALVGYFDFDDRIYNKMVYGVCRYVDADKCFAIVARFDNNDPIQLFEILSNDGDKDVADFNT